jgi:anthranilate phosphoribosyltransferase
VTELLPDGSTRTYDVTPEDVGLTTHPLAAVKGGEPAHNARQLRLVLEGGHVGAEAEAKRELVLFNAGAALYLADLAETLREGVELARESLDSGAAMSKLERYLEFTNA